MILQVSALQGLADRNRAGARVPEICIWHHQAPRNCTPAPTVPQYPTPAQIHFMQVLTNCMATPCSRSRPHSSARAISGPTLEMAASSASASVGPLAVVVVRAAGVAVGAAAVDEGPASAPAAEPPLPDAPRVVAAPAEGALAVAGVAAAAAAAAAMAAPVARSSAASSASHSSTSLRPPRVYNQY